MFRVFLAAAAMSGALVVGGCASGPETKGSGGDPPYAEILSQPQRLKPVAATPGALEWEDPAVDLRRYRSVLLERIQIRLAEDANNKSIDPADLKAMVDAFHQAIVKALGTAYPVVTKPGPGVLRVRIVIYDLVPTEAMVSVGVFFTPYALVPDLLGGSAAEGKLGAAPYLGRTGIAVQFIDAATGQVVAEYADERFGRKYVIDTNQGVTTAVTTGVMDYVRAFSTWAYAQQAFDYWALQFRRRLDQVNGR